ncbi:MAG: hypothetical protein DI498_07785 [Paracoccus denitrificans]|nr:MAG: hypothetical protein DI498_07785 [Paracoccus denitrificans]PZO84427.1 MAG: hypothetical protein DI633_07785 [Paracoccus denitrificans]
MTNELEPVWSSTRVWNGVTIDHDGRAFVSFPSCDGPGVQLARLDAEGNAQPYPDPAWNKVRETPDPAAGFVNVNAARIGPDGKLWVIDGGAQGIGKPAVPGGGRLIVFDTDTDTHVDTIDLAPCLKPNSYVDDIRFNGDFIYVTDAGAPGMVVVNRQTGQMRRVLNDHFSTTDQRAMYADGKLLLTEDGSELRVHNDQIEVSPDGSKVYYQPSSGPLYVLPSALLDDFDTPEETIAGAVTEFFDGGTTGGTAIDAAGTIYLNSTNRRQLLRIYPDGTSDVLLQDDRLIWADAMWITGDGYLYIPATQQNRTPGFNAGRMTVQYPVWIYRLKIDQSPALNDHS